MEIFAVFFFLTRLYFIPLLHKKKSLRQPSIQMTETLIDVAYLALMTRMGLTDMFITPNVLMRNRPEKFVLENAQRAFVVGSGTGGINGHAHALKQLTLSELAGSGHQPVGTAAEVYFVCLSEWLHSHPDENTVYYVGRDVAAPHGYSVFDLATRAAVTHNGFAAGHYHGLAVTDVVQKVSAAAAAAAGQSAKMLVDSDSDSDSDDDDDSDSDDDDSRLSHHHRRRRHVRGCDDESDTRHHHHRHNCCDDDDFSDSCSSYSGSSSSSSSSSSTPRPRQAVIVHSPSSHNKKKRHRSFSNKHEEQSVASDLSGSTSSGSSSSSSSSSSKPRRHHRTKDRRGRKK